MGKGGYTGGSTVIHAGTGWFGKGSVTSQPSEKKPKNEPRQHRANKAKKKKPKQEYSNPKGNGLTIPEQIRAAERKVGRITSEIAQTERKIAELKRQLVDAKSVLEKTRNLPRRTALGDALLEAKRAEAKQSS